MLKNKNSKLLFLGVLLLIVFSSIHIYVTLKESQDIKTTILLEETQSISSFFRSVRKTYQDVFINNHIKITEETIDFLPVKTSNTMNEHFSKSLNAKVILKTVSDMPRNPLNLANKEEMQIIEKFKKNPETKYIFEEGKNNIYKYYEPLYIKKICLNCHGKFEDAPPLIQERYKTAFDYKLNDLRGIMSLEIDKSHLVNKIVYKDRHTLFYIIINMIILTSIIIFLYFRLKHNHENSEKQLKSKNRFLEVKSKEFEGLQNALGVSEIISTTDLDGTILSVNEKFCEVSGYDKDELIGKNHNIIRHPDTKDKVFTKMWKTIENKEVFKTLIKNKRKDGSSYHVDTTIVPILNEEGSIEKYLALRHYVEDMMNHNLLLQEMIKASKRSVLVLMKIEGFDELEDFYTAEIISSLERKFLKESLKYLPSNCQFQKTYKLENGVFAFTKEIEENEDFYEEKNQGLKEFQKNVKNAKYVITGYVFNPSVLLSVSSGKHDIFEDAKLGLKKLLSSNKNIINANGLSEDSRKTAETNIKTINIIKNAIDTDNIVSYFQPLYNNKTKKIEKYESLVRLVESSGNVLSPYFFLELAKKGKYYNHITQIVIANSFKTLEKVEEDISINLSFLDIEDDETRECFYGYMNNSKNAHRIIVELLEDESTKDFNVIQNFIKKIKEKGIKIAIDDFGSGYSNFERLMQFQPDILKIDGSLIKNIDTNNHNRNVVETIQKFASKEGIRTVAEFVHNKEIFDIVNEIGINYTQGYYISEPKII